MYISTMIKTETANEAKGKTMKIYQNEDIEGLRRTMRRAGCVYDSSRGWFRKGSPIGIYYDAATDVWFTVL